MAYYVEPGVTSNGITFSKNIMYVSSGATANSTTIKISGYMYVSSGGVANSTYLGQSCYMYVSSGGKIYDTTIQGLFPKASVNLSAGAVAYRTLASNGGSFCVAGSAGDTTVDRGELHIFNGGIAYGNTVKAGEMHVSGGGIASNTQQLGGTMRIFSGGVAKDNTVSSGGVHVSDGGIASNTIIDGDVNTYISSGGFMYNTTVNNGGYIRFFSGGNADGVIINSGGSIYVSKGGCFSNGTIHSGGDLTLYGTAKNLTVYAGTEIYANKGATLELAYSPWNVVGDIWCQTTMLERDKKVYLGGAAGLVSKTDHAANWEITSGLSAIVFNCGEADYTTVFSGGYAYNRGGTMFGLTVKDGGRAYVSKGALADTLYVSQGGNVYVWSGGTVKNAYTQSFGCLYVYDGGIASSTKLMTNGNLYIYSGGKAFDTVTSFGVRINMYGGTMSNLNMQRGTIVSAYKGAIVSNTTVDYGSYLMLGYDGDNCTGAASAAETTILSGGGLTVMSGAIAEDTVNYGTLTCNNGGTLLGETVIHGRANLAGNAVVTDETSITFDVSERSASAMQESYREAMLNSYYVAREADMTISVSADQEEGSYILANWALEAKKGTFTLEVDGTEVGTFSTTKSLTYDGKTYSLYCFDDSTNSKALTLKVSDAVAMDAWTELGSGDFDGDGIDESLVSDGTNLYAASEDLWLGNLSGTEEIASITDYNNDGTDDLLIHNTATDQMTAWLIKDGATYSTLAIA